MFSYAFVCELQDWSVFDNYKNVISDMPGC